MCVRMILVIAPFVDGFVPKKANKYRETRVEVTFKNSAGETKGTGGWLPSLLWSGKGDER